MKTLNPYKRAASLLWGRVAWDFNLNSWRSRRKLKSLKNSQLAKSCVILCNGPSLLEVDFDLLSSSNIYTFGLNKINLLFEKVKFRPKSIVAVNRYVLEQNKEYFANTSIPLFLDSYADKLGLSARSNICYLHSSDFSGEFAPDCSMSINQGYTVTFVAMQLAFHFGFEKVALVGCDHNFETKGEANKTVIAEQSDPNHFDPNYFSNGVKWQLPDLEQSELAYRVAKLNYELAGRKLYNCSVGGHLEVFPRLSLAEFLRA
ncbi:6-hydroxymethylpterin diphosphokinase MptE-like protein [Aliikangiella maris]|uniref:6-hydroxymethylpterin diphosphokinase MptE-like protein n=2 Tax=Aliikangiella maris TaxID=3162458 RepID=A0ABV2BRZ2_9GAMM